MINLLLITIIIVAVTDFTDFFDNIKLGLKRWLGVKGNISIKPLGCSTCETFWVLLVYLLCTGFTLVGFTEAVLLAVFTPQIQEVIALIKDLISFLLYQVSRNLR